MENSPHSKLIIFIFVCVYTEELGLIFYFIIFCVITLVYDLVHDSGGEIKAAAARRRRGTSAIKQQGGSNNAPRRVTWPLYTSRSRRSRLAKRYHGRFEMTHDSIQVTVWELKWEESTRYIRQCELVNSFGRNYHCLSNSTTKRFRSIPCPTNFGGTYCSL